MELNHVEEFIALTKTENYLEAAENLSTSQSSLSKHVKSLEVEFGATLLDRTIHQTKLNEAGKAFLRYAQQLIDVQCQCNTVLINLEETEEQSLIIDLVPTMTPYGITDMLIGLRKASVKINLSIIEGETGQFKQKLRDDNYDLILIRRSLGQKEVTEDSDDFAVTNSTTDYLTAVLPNDRPLVNQILIDLSELKSEELLFLPLYSVIHNISLQTCRQAGFMPSIAYTGKRARNVINLISKGTDISLLVVRPTSYISARSLVKLVPALPHIETEIAAYYKKGVSLLKAASHFLEFVQRQRSGLPTSLLLKIIHFRNRLLQEGNRFRFCFQVI